MIWHLHINKSANLYTILKYLTVYSLKCLPFKIICSLLQKRSIAFISNLSQRCVPPYRVAFSVKESNILYIFISFEVQLLGVLAPPSLYTHFTLTAKSPWTKSLFCLLSQNWCNWSSDHHNNAALDNCLWRNRIMGL